MIMLVRRRDTKIIILWMIMVTRRKKKGYKEGIPIMVTLRVIIKRFALAWSWHYLSGKDVKIYDFIRTKSPIFGYQKSMSLFKG